MNKTLQFLVDQLETPIGQLFIVADQDGNLRAAGWKEHQEEMRRLLQIQYGQGALHLEPTQNPNGLTRALTRYFAGELNANHHPRQRCR